MSALGQKQTFRSAIAMSALPPESGAQLIAVAAEAATEATKQENDEDDNEDESQRHGAIFFQS
jgi:hypothetical protein